MNIASIGQHAFKKKSLDEELVINDADPVIEHASREMCTYVCDVMYRMGIRSYDPQLAKLIADQLLSQHSAKNEQRWAKYLEGTAPQVQQELLLILGIADTAR
jgi:hypothetical protein